MKKALLALLLVSAIAVLGCEKKNTTTTITTPDGKTVTTVTSPEGKVLSVTGK